MNAKKRHVSVLYRGLLRTYGRPRGQWRVWCKRSKTTADRERIVIEAILTQRTNWRNVERVVKRMHQEKILSFVCLYDRYKNNTRGLESVIRSSGFYRAKARYLVSLAGFFLKNGGIRVLMKQDHDSIRPRLLALPGIGHETADSILLYGLDKLVFIVDEYTRRFIHRHQLASYMSYNELQTFFEEKLPKDVKLYQDFHALIVINGQAK